MVLEAFSEKSTHWVLLELHWVSALGDAVAGIDKYQAASPCTFFLTRKQTLIATSTAKAFPVRIIDSLEEGLA